MQRSVPVPASPPPSYEEAMASVGAVLPPPVMQAPYVPPRYLGPTEGRNSIRYSEMQALYDTTRLYLVDNKSADIASLNYQNDHSSFLTSVVQNSDFSPQEASTQTVNLDERSRWGGELKTILHTCMPNVNEFMFSNSFRARLMTQKKNGVAEYKWVELTIPEGNFSEIMTLDLMNNAVVEHYLQVGRQNGVEEADIGVKFDTRNFRLGYDPVTKLVTPGSYTYEAFHPDIILLPGCAVDFTYSRLSNLLGIRKRQPFQEGFIIEYDDLVGGNIPALLDVAAYEGSLQGGGGSGGGSTTAAETRDGPAEDADGPVLVDADDVEYEMRGDGHMVRKRRSASPVAEPAADPIPNSPVIKPITKDSKNRTYHVDEVTNQTAYRSWYLAYNYGDPEKGVRSWTLLTTPDVTCGSEQVYWSLPDMMVDPVTFRPSQSPSNYPVVGAELMPVQSRTFFNDQAVYSQLIRQNTSKTHVFNRFPDNQILVRPPAPTITAVSENVPAHTNHGTLAMRHSLRGVQRVTVTDARRRTCPYIYKTLGIVTPRVLSSRTF
ncbi:III [Titi monkey adenovirus ECC-2011]|uniref:Penton protein n=1 Tax=titi monkey adenovirus 1 TaxID=3123084 RepID=G0ZAI0_9ADEN|nr:III [Titi monkey adenovirus ECC-2011]AEK98451.1 III [Titi monkey adenovirus ECC-2011]